MELSAQTRDLKTKTQELLSKGLLPAVVFGKETKPTPVAIKQLDFFKAFREAGEASIIDLKIEGEKGLRPVLVSEIQRSPLNSSPIHIGFHQIVLKEKVTVHVPIVFVGEAPAVKNSLGVLLELLNEIEVEAFPRDLPNHFTVDISGLTEVNQGIHVKDLGIDASKIEVKASPEELVAKIDYLTKEEEPAPEAAAATTEAEAIAGVEATKELTPEEKAKREEAKKAEKKAEEKK